MIEVILAFKDQGANDKTFFKAISLLDYCIQEGVVTDQNIHLVGICCIFLSSKLIDYAPISLYDVYIKIA